MSSSKDSGELASDIITYVGVPLAVAGLLPILWSSLVTFTAWRKIKAKLRRNNLSAITRSDAFTRIIEVQFVKYNVMPTERLGPESDYWQRALKSKEIRNYFQEGHQDYIAGGTWAILHWKKRRVGDDSQRIQYADELRQPQVGVNFEQLIAYIYDLGAIPDRTGWTKLRSNGLWIAPNTPLMNSPTNSNKPLLVTAPFDHSDGQLSLALTEHWGDEWEVRNHLSVPPYSVRLPISPNRAPEYEGMIGLETLDTNEITISKSEGGKKVEFWQNEEVVTLASNSRAQKIGAKILCEISKEGLCEAYEELTQTNESSPSGRNIPTAHLRAWNGTSREGVWFASLITACRVKNESILWKYRVPVDILAFSTGKTIPCGVLEQLGIVNSTHTPSWTTLDLSHEHARLMLSKRLEDRVLAERAEQVYQQEDRQTATRERLDREHRQEMEQRNFLKLREDQTREDRIRDALRSPSWNAAHVADHSLIWLKTRKYFLEVSVIKDAVLIILSQMVMDSEFSASICSILNLWKDWASNGGMRREDLATLQKSPEMFAQTILLVAVLAELSTEPQDVLLDLEECVTSWENVKLG